MVCESLVSLTQLAGVSEVRDSRSPGHGRVGGKEHTVQSEIGWQFKRIGWVWRQRKIDLFFPSSSSYSSHYFECFLVGWEFGRVNTLWLENEFFLLGLLNNLFFWGWSQMLLLPNPGHHWVAKALFFKNAKGKEFKLSWNKVQGARTRGRGLLGCSLSSHHELSSSRPFNANFSPVIV